MIRPRYQSNQTPLVGGPRPKLQHHSFADNKPLTAGRSLIKGWLFQEQSSVIFGPPNCGKTFMALDASLRVAAGWAWGGSKVKQAGVVYVAAEAGKSISNRIEAFKLHHRLMNVALPFEVVTSSIDLCTIGNNDLKALCDLISEEVGPKMLVKPCLIVIDTVSRALSGGNENSPDDMGRFVKALDYLRDLLGCHVLAVHHTGKDRDRGARGHSLLYCNVDTRISVEAVNGITTATVLAQRDGPTNLSKSFKLVPVIVGYDEDDEPVTSCVTEATDAPPKETTGQLGRAIKVLEGLIRDRGQKVDLIDERRIVETEAWREACARAFKWTPENRMSWSRIWVEAKRVESRVGVSADEDHVWLKTEEEWRADKTPM